MMRYLRDVYTVMYGWMLEANGRHDYPHLLALLAFGITLGLNFATLSLLVSVLTDWSHPLIHEHPEVLAAAILALPFGAYAVSLRGRDHDADLQRLRESEKEEDVGETLVYYLVLSAIALILSGAIAVHETPA